MGIDTGKASNKGVIAEGRARRAGSASDAAARNHTAGVTAVAQDRDLLEQFLALGLDRPRAAQLFQQGCAALDDVLADIDLHAFESVPVADQVSMLLPRLDIERVAQSTGVSTAQAQSAMAMLTLDFATRVR